MARELLLQGMLGLGDNIHQRAIIRQLMKEYNVTLETPWPCIYRDFVGHGLRLVNRSCTLRTQAKNARRERNAFSVRRNYQKIQKVWYTHDQVRNNGGFLAAMCANSRLPKGDFSLPVPAAWVEKAREAIGETDKPIMVYRPLVTRTEWDGCMQRNPDPAAYVEIAKAIKDRFYVVSIADLAPKIEWIVSDPIGADIEFHAGELDAEAIAGLMGIAGLVYCSPGFGLVMAQAVGAPMVAVFGGHESARLYNHGSATDCFVEPEKPCECFSKLHKCDKRINVKNAINNVMEFIDGHCKKS